MGTFWCADSIRLLQAFIERAGDLAQIDKVVHKSGCIYVLGRHKSAKEYTTFFIIYNPEGYVFSAVFRDEQELLGLARHKYVPYPCFTIDVADFYGVDACDLYMGRAP